MSSPQRSVDSGFGPETTAGEAMGGRDLSGKTAIVTGGYSGIGLETTRVLSRAGATVVVPARTVEKARSRLEGIPRVEIAALDLLEPASIDAFAGVFLAAGRPLDLLINNAGIMACPASRDGRGNEAQFSANHLGHFRLTVRLWPALARAGSARVVALSSRGHRYSDVHFDDPNFLRRSYDKWAAYGQSKTANALFALGVDLRGESQGIRAFSVHPGSIVTDLMRHLDDQDLAAMGIRRGPDGGVELGPEFLARLRIKTVEQGAATTIWCATSPWLNGVGGVYCEDSEVAEVIPGDRTAPKGVAPYAADPGAAERLWALSEELTGLRT